MSLNQSEEESGWPIYATKFSSQLGPPPAYTTQLYATKVDIHGSDLSNSTYGTYDVTYEWARVEVSGKTGLKFMNGEPLGARSTTMNIDTMAKLRNKVPRAVTVALGEAGISK